MINRILKYKKLIFLVVFYLVKYQLLLILLTNRQLLRKMNSLPKKSITPFTPALMQPKRRFYRQIDMIINRINPSTTCLVRSAIKRDVMLHFGVTSKILLGVRKEENILKAHSWLIEEKSQGFLKLCQLS